MTAKTFLFPLWWHTHAVISHYYLLCLNWNILNWVRIGPIHSIVVDFWSDVTFMKVALKHPWGWDRCMYQTGIVLRKRMESPSERITFLGLIHYFSLPYFSRLLVWKYIKPINTKIIYVLLKFTNWNSWPNQARFGLRPSSMIVKCGEFNLNPTWDTAEIVN